MHWHVAHAHDAGVKHGVIQDSSKRLFSKQAGFVGRTDTTKSDTTNFTASETTRYHLSNNRREQRTSHRGGGPLIREPPIAQDPVYQL